MGRENIFILTIENEILHEDSNDNGVGTINDTTSKNLLFKSTIFPNRNIHKYTSISRDVKTQPD
jgi:hypothetical protein